MKHIKDIPVNIKIEGIECCVRTNTEKNLKYITAKTKYAYDMYKILQHYKSGKLVKHETHTLGCKEPHMHIIIKFNPKKGK